MTDKTTTEGIEVDRFEGAYQRGEAPWDIGKPQPEVMRLHGAGMFGHRVLDIGCGTGENALYLARESHEVVGADASQTAVEQARIKAMERKIDARFVVADALALAPEPLGGRFDTVLDSGVFHVFDDHERPAYAASLHRVLSRGGLAHIIVFSDKEPADWGGPRRIGANEFEEAFRAGWTVERVVATRFDTVLDQVEGRAWRATLRRR